MNRSLTLVLAAFAVAALPATAQDKAKPAPAATVEKSVQIAKPEELRMKIQSDKKGIVERNMQLTADEAKKFWPLYDEFQKALAEPQSQINRAVLDYVAAENKMTDANAKRLAEDLLKAEATEDKLRADYFGKFEKALGAKKAARYLQIENKMRAVIRYETAAAIPLVH